MAYKLLSQSRKLNEQVRGRGWGKGRRGIFEKKSGGTLIRDPGVGTSYLIRFV